MNHQKIRHDGMRNFAVCLTVETNLWYYLEAPSEDDAIDEVKGMFNRNDGSSGYEDSATEWESTLVASQAHIMEQY